MARIMLTEAQFRTLIGGGVVTVTTPPVPRELREGNAIEIALSDIGYALMMSIVSEASEKNFKELYRNEHL